MVRLSDLHETEADHLRARAAAMPELAHPMPLLLRHLVDDVRGYYHEALAAQPGETPPNHDALNAWIFGPTAFGEILLQLGDHLTAADENDPMAAAGRPPTDTRWWSWRRSAPRCRDPSLAEAAASGVELTVMVLDITDERDRQAAFGHEIDVLVNNAGHMETGPVAEIPMELVRRNFETNVFATLAMCQGFAPQMVRRGSGKIVNVSSMGGLITVPFAAIYTSTKHALEGLSEGLKAELAGTGVEVCTVNPGVYGTGFNDRGAETMLRWFDPATTLTAPETLAALTEGADLDGQLDPQGLVDGLVRVVEEDASKFRNVIPEEIVPWIQAIHAQTWTAGRDDVLFLDPNSLG